MGQILQATCPCGFDSTKLFLGGGMMNFTTYCGAPALCDSCGAFLVLNYLDPNPRCGDCKGTVRFYNDPALRSTSEQSDQKSHDVFSWNVGGRLGTFSLPDTEYLCPKCREIKMSFVSVGNWD